MDDIVRQFQAVGGKATFFVNGLNYDCIYNRADSLRSAYNAGFQIASHTWSHPDITGLTASQFTTELTKLNTALSKIIGAIPTYFRPPYGNQNQANLNVLQQNGFTTSVLWSLDSGDSTGASVSQSEQTYNSSPKIPHIALNHETHQSTDTQLTPFIISWAQQRGLRMVTVAECLGDGSPYLHRVYPSS
jgi:peptidoglycan/xylan/chitin deacetylase (PgdA/CDA1 family)